MRPTLAVLLSGLLALTPVGVPTVAAQAPEAPLEPAVFEPLKKSLQKSYLTLFDEASGLEFSSAQIEKMEDYLDDAQDYCEDRFESRTESLEDSLDEAQKELRERSADLSDEERHNRHCRIQNLRILRSQSETLENHAIPVAYENKKAKLKLIQQWPQDLRQIRRTIETGEYHNREYGNPKDIGFRAVGEEQEEDIEDGQEAIERMRRQGLMPEAVENEQVQNYVTELAQKIARNSDLRVPIKVEVLNSKEINAFALPGGFLFLQRGLLEETEDEAQLAGVVAHEIAHAAARHGHQLMKRATISSIIYQAAQIAALVLTGGAAGIGTYYALQYGFYGLGLVLSLDLLGVSRDFELEADQLGIQYAWKAGYDPSGFIRFFDKMATTKGYVDGLSWFRTHPPFYERMVQSKKEMMFLPEQETTIVQTDAFKQMKEELEKVTEAAEEQEQRKPSLKLPESDCPPPDKIEYEPGQPIEALCEIGEATAK